MLSYTDEKSKSEDSTYERPQNVGYYEKNEVVVTCSVGHNKL